MESLNEFLNKHLVGKEFNGKTVSFVEVQENTYQEDGYIGEDHYNGIFDVTVLELEIIFTDGSKFEV